VLQLPLRKDFQWRDICGARAMHTVLGSHEWSGLGNSPLAGEQANEKQRLDALATYRILSGHIHPRISRIASVIGDALRVPIVTISLMPETGIVRLATNVDLPSSAPARANSLTVACIEQGSTLVVPDTRAHPALRDHPLVANAPYCIAAASSPLRTPDGFWLGAVNIWVTQPRHFTDSEISLLENFAQIVSDELELHRAILKSRQQQAMLHAMFDNSAIALAVYRQDGTRVAVNQRYCDMFGYRAAELLGQTTADVDLPDEYGAKQTNLERVVRGELQTYARESKLLHKSGRTIWCRFTLSRIVNPESGEALAISFVENINDQYNAEEARTLLLGEINHRVKNTLAIVQGIARQLMRTSPDLTEFAPAFEARVQALSQSHDLLTQASWEALPLDRVVSQLLSDTWQPYHERFTYTGTAISLNSQTTVMLWLLLNELITNAVKHGALQCADGTIALTATRRVVDGQIWVDLDWREKCGRRIEPPRKKGLGTYLLERGPKLGLSGTGTLMFEPAGVHYVIGFPIYDCKEPFQKGLTQR
jgi:PAS domain S-box-containing protein